MCQPSTVASVRGNSAVNQKRYLPTMALWISQNKRLMKSDQVLGAYEQAITPKLMKRRVLFNGKKLRDVQDAILVSCMTQTHVQRFTGHEDILS
jgi:hypothetical protein